MRKERIIAIVRVAKFIEQNPDTHLREIARNLKMNPAIVHRTLQDINDFITSRSFNETGVSLPNMPVLIRLKEGITAEGILKFLKIKEKLGEGK